MSTTSQNSDPLPIFMGENHDFWSIKMKTYFMSQDLWDIVDSGFNNPENPTVEQLRQLKKDQQKDAKALYALQQALHDTIFPRIMGATTAREAWNTLKEEFQGNAKDSETTQDYYAKIKIIINQLRAYGENINDSRIVEKILISLPDKYDPLVTAIEQSKDLTSLSVTELIGST
ncbi:unnamed protein product [Prunus armeniaca]